MLQFSVDCQWDMVEMMIQSNNICVYCVEQDRYLQKFKNSDDISSVVRAELNTRCIVKIILSSVCYLDHVMQSSHSLSTLSFNTS